MNLESQFKLQAYLDGELAAGDISEVESLLVGDNDARLLLSELKNTKTALAGHDAEIKLPESREFFWHKIEGAIQRESQPILQSSEPVVPGWWRKLLFPFAVAVPLVALVLIVARQNGPTRNPSTTGDPALARHFYEHEFPDAHGFTFRDQSAGMTVVWVSYANEEGFTDGGLIDSIQ